MRSLIWFMVFILTGAPAFGASVLTNKGDNLRSGLTVSSLLTPAYVGSSLFGLRAKFICPGDAAQPLIYDNGGVRYLLIVTSSANVCVFNADATGTPNPLWNVSLGQAFNVNDNTFLPHNNEGCRSTPAIDGATGIAYFICHITNSPNLLYSYYVKTGVQFHAPVNMDATDAATGRTFQGQPNTVAFRPGLLLDFGNIYAASSNPPDAGVWLGGILGYNATTLAPVGWFCVSCDANPTIGGGSIWHAGSGLLSDGSNIYANTGNGSPTATYIESAIKVSPALALVDWFTPSNWPALNGGDQDMVTGMTIQNGNVIWGGKRGDVYVVRANNMGHLQGGGGIAPIQVIANDANQVGYGFSDGLFVTATDLYMGQTSGFNPGTARYNWTGTQYDLTGTAGFQANAVSALHCGYPGAMFTMTWDGTNANSRVLWQVCDNTFFALDPITLVTLFSSDTRPTDVLGVGPHLATPIGINNIIYVPTRRSDGAVMAYGHLVNTFIP